MRASTFLITVAIVTLLASAVRAEPIRYRGEYTYGHEVNIFCPAINSQCYWLSGDTPDEVRYALQTLAAQNTSKPYQPNCVVIEAEIERDTKRDGFAADYDGLVTVMKSYGRCDETGIITQGDLRHHRWVLESINGEALDADELDGKIPDLDFGERIIIILLFSILPAKFGAVFWHPLRQGFSAMFLARNFMSGLATKFSRICDIFVICCSTILVLSSDAAENQGIDTRSGARRIS